MKKLILMAGLFVTMQAMANEKKVKSDVTNVTVFTQGAQVFRKANITATPGVTNYVFNGLSKFINPLSIQAGGSGNFTILEVKHSIAYPQPAAKKETKLPQNILKDITSIEDSITEINFSVAEVAEQKNALLLEKDMIIKNKLAKGEGKSDSLPVLKQAMEYFRIKLTDINAQLATINRSEWKHQKLLTRLNERLQELRTYRNSEEPTIVYEPEHQVVVTISAEAATPGTLTINYMVQGAGWVPLYDLRSTSAGAPMQLTYKANVYQSSGELWDNVKLKLSTSNPNKGNLKPELPTWYVDYFNTQPAKLKSPQGART
ncbi:MAG: mucoidy inhibitor MuiA family protein [Bacteroidetes bacterium]|nr:mucoidy inhibitor MuiA family protein [Bacteroidota bacterium]